MAEEVMRYGRHAPVLKPAGSLEVCIISRRQLANHSGTFIPHCWASTERRRA
jgi:hypothetical protein